MPHMSGPELAQKITKLHPEAGVLYMSGYTEDTINQHGILDSGTTLINKPIRTADFTETIRSILDGDE